MEEIRSSCCSNSCSGAEVKQVSTSLTLKDTLGSWKARWGINRMDYKVEPGLYCIGSPGESSPILVSANYKMSFDRLRRELGGLDAWILVLDTKGVNVWCAAGKGTFGTDELVGRILETELSSKVTEKLVIVPQLGAPGIAAHEVQKRTGFKVVYGPVRANDIKAFLNAGMVASKEMRSVKFTFADRLVLTPMEIVNSIKPASIVFAILFILNSLGFGSYGIKDLYAFIGAILVGCVITPILLPYIPGRAFALKGALVGLIWAALIVIANGFDGLSTYGLFKDMAYMFILPTVSSYGAMNFTGCSTYTSFSGVKREMKIALPIMIISLTTGALVLIAGAIINYVL